MGRRGRAEVRVARAGAGGAGHPRWAEEGGPEAARPAAARAACWGCVPARQPHPKHPPHLSCSICGPPRISRPWIRGTSGASGVSSGSPPVTCARGWDECSKRNGITGSSTSKPVGNCSQALAARCIRHADWQAGAVSRCRGPGRATCRPSSLPPSLPTAAPLRLCCTVRRCFCQSINASVRPALRGLPFLIRPPSHTRDTNLGFCLGGRGHARTGESQERRRGMQRRQRARTPRCDLQRCERRRLAGSETAQAAPPPPTHPPTPNKRLTRGSLMSYCTRSPRSQLLKKMNLQGCGGARTAVSEPPPCTTRQQMQPGADRASR